jgi:hypothetical protein
MYTNPNMLGQLAKDHQRQLLREAEVDRQVMRAHAEQPTPSMRLRLRASALLFALGRLIQPRDARQSRKAGLNRSLA